MIDRHRRVALRRSTTLPSGSTMQPSRSARATGSGTSRPVLSSITENTFVTGHLLGIFVAPSGQAFRHRVQEFDAARRVDGDHRIGNRGERDLCSFLFLEDLRFGLLAIRDVGQRRRPCAAACRPGPSTERPRVRNQRYDAVLHANAEFEVERVAGAQVSCAGPRPPHGGRADGSAAGTTPASPASCRARSPAAIRIGPTGRGARCAGSNPRCRRCSRARRTRSALRCCGARFRCPRGCE